MNKKLIALAVAATSLSSVANAAEVYSDNTSSVDVTGRIETAAVLSDHDVSNEGYNKARIGFAGQTEIADGINALGYVEKDFADDSEDYRYLFVGVANENNQLGYGKADGSLGMITDFTDIMSFGGDAAGDKIAAGDRADNNLAYVGTFNNLTVKANYVFDGGKSDTDQNHKGYSASAKYAMDNGLAFGLGYGAQNNGNTDQNNEQTFLGASYTVGNLYFGALFQDGHRHDITGLNDSQDHQRGYEYATAYTMGNTVFTATYNYLEVIHSADAPVLVNQAGIDATYYFNPNFRAYVGYTYFIEDSKASLSETDNITSMIPNNNQFAIGARYDF